MKNFIELKYHKNSKFEIIFENLDEIKEGDNVVLKLKDGDLSPLFHINVIDNLFIPYLPIDKEIAIELDGLFYEKYLWARTLDNDFIYDIFRDSEEVKTVKNILPKWNIPEDSAVLFLSEEDKEKYIFDSHTGITLKALEDGVMWKLISKEKIKNISLIIPELHAEDKTCKYHVENVNNVCKELKEKYGIERVELFVSHCFVKFSVWQNFSPKDQISYNSVLINKSININDYLNDKYEVFIKYINKITTTNSTCILEVQKSDRLEVIDCIEFFK